MPEMPAARVTDMHVCPMATGVVPHLGGPIIPPNSLNVQTNDLFQARATDKASCVGPIDFIVVGSSTVFVNDLMAARTADQTMHGGLIGPGSINVLIGGPPGGATLGNPVAGQAACVAAVGGRNPSAALGLPAQTQSQSYNNCGVESSRQIINQANGSNVSQEILLTQAMVNGQATAVPGNLQASGGTTPTTRVQLLQTNGVPASEVTPSMQNMQQAVAEHRGVIVAVMAGTLWGAAGGIPAGQGPHAILVTGLQYDATGKLQNVFINDTGMGTCTQPVPVATFQAALTARGGANHVVTNNPIW